MLRATLATVAVTACALSFAPSTASAQNAPWGAPPPPSAQASAWGELSTLPLEHPRCIESDTTARVAVELLAGFGAGAAILGGMMAVVFLPDDGRVREDRLLPALVMGGVASLILPPLAVYGVGRAYNGDGSYSAAFLGNMLLGFPGAVIGYEVTTTPACRHGAANTRAPHPRRAQRRPAERSPSVAPFFVPPTAAQGASMFGLTLQM